MSLRIGEGETDIDEVHEINVTPFIDVMLVLLIIFMVAAPLATTNVPVELPGSTAKPPPKPDKPVVLTLQSDLSLSLANTPVERANLAGALDRATGGTHDTTIYLKADQEIAYGDLMDLMNGLREAGYLQVALVGRQDNA